MNSSCNTSDSKGGQTPGGHVGRDPYSLPLHSETEVAPLAFQVVYYFIFMPLAYVGNLLTCVVVVRIMKYRHSVPDVLVGGLALNDFLTCVIVFTPSLVARVAGRWFGAVFCQFHAVTTTWYLLTTFAIIVLMSVERWLAIVKPFYHQRSVSTLQMKLVIAALGLFCLLLGSIPTAFYPVTLQAGWYCTISTWRPSSGRPGMEHSGVPPTLSLAVNLTYISIGMTIVVVFTSHIVVTLNRKPSLGSDQHGRRLEKRFALIMLIVGSLFFITWLPQLVSLNICLKNSMSTVCYHTRYYSSRIINMSVAINPIIYGVMKHTYRRGYIYLIRSFLHYASCTLIPAPQDSDLVFDVRPGRMVSKVSTANSSLGRPTPQNAERHPQPVSNDLLSAEEQFNIEPAPASQTNTVL